MNFKANPDSADFRIWNRDITVQDFCCESRGWIWPDKMCVNAHITTKPQTAPHRVCQYELIGSSLSFWTHSVSPCPSSPAAAPSPGAAALTNSWITISPLVQPGNIPVSLLCLPRAQSDPIPAITLTTAAPGATLELDGLMTSANSR